jgi:DNA-binding transcriptional regulator LsrR (DeoR family)/sugar phosphate isomerase/epimerase
MSDAPTGTLPPGDPAGAPPGDLTLGINLSFATKRWVTPELWAPLVREQLGLDLVQLSFDLIDPTWPDALLDAQADRVRSVAAAHDITVHSAFVGLAHYSHAQLLHPEPAVRDAAMTWLERAYRFAARAGIGAVGGPLGAVAADQDKVGEADYQDLLGRLHRLVETGRAEGLHTLYIEPTPLPREWPSTIEQAERLAADLAGSALPWRYCLDWGHGTYAPLYGAGADMATWLQRLAPWTGMIHLQQTDGQGDRHWDFTVDGMVDPQEAADAQKRAGLEQCPAFLEVFYPFEASDAHVLDVVTRSVARLGAQGWGGTKRWGGSAPNPLGPPHPWALPPVTEPPETVARAVWLYHMGMLTQQEIADQLGLTRLRVNRILGQARLDGSVRVEVRLPLAGCVALEGRLMERFSLTRAIVVPSVANYPDTQRTVGEAAGSLLDGLLASARTIGVGWGRTLRESLRRITPRTLPGARVVALMGGLTHGSGTNTFEVATGFAEALGADCHYLAAPIYCPDPETRQALLTHVGLAGVMERAQAADVALVSCGDLSQRSLLAATHMVHEELEVLRQLGTVGDLLGTFLDRTGAPVAHPLNRRVMALAPEGLRRVAVSVLASGGTNKAPAIAAILAGGYVNHLVTDEACAEVLLA